MQKQSTVRPESATMEHDQKITSGSRRRTRGLEAEKRAGAIERLKALRQGGRRTSADGPSYDVKLDEPIYQVMEEDEYEKFVSNRRKEVADFIEADDADGDLGYIDDGGEEDWTQATRSYASDESDSGGSVPRRKKAEKKEEPSSRPNKSAAALSAAAAMMGKPRLASMFTSSNFNKKTRETDKLKCESIIDDVIKQFAPDESDRVQRRRPHQSVQSAGSQQPLGVYEMVNTIKCEDQLVADGDWIDTAEKKCAIIEDEKRLETTVENASPIVNGDASEQKKIGDDVEMKEASPIYEEEKVVPKLNAKIGRVEKDAHMSANEDWKALKSDSKGDVNVISEKKDSTDIGVQLALELDADSSLPFYIIDAHEVLFGPNIGNLYLFGKIRSGDAYHSCCVVVKNMQRRVYAIPVDSVFQEVMLMEKDADESQIHPHVSRNKLQELASGLKNELARHLLSLNVSNFSMTPVMRSYAFERSDVPFGDNHVLKINYPFKDPPLPADLKGETFSALFGTHCSALELFLVKRKIKGPSWLSISKISSFPDSQKVSWCKFEVVVNSPKDIKTAPSSNSRMEIPPVVVSAINLKTVINVKLNVNEIVSASIICCRKAKIDSPMLPSEWKKPGTLSHFTIIRKLDGGIFPMGFAKEVTDRNLKAGSTVLVYESSERSLLNRLMLELYKLDSDVLAGHNVSGFDLDVLLHRAQACKVPSSMWSKIGRLNRSEMPKLAKGSTIFGSGASPGIMSCMAGRLLCDTYLSSRDLLKEVSYSLTQLAKTQLKKERRELTPHDIPRMFQTSESLMELVECGETDAWLSMELMFHLSILPLTRQLTNISGNLWGKTLQGARAQRVEYLLLHAFREFDGKKYIVPDKISTRMKESKTSKRTNRVEVGDNDEDIRDATEDHNEQRTGKKGPAYAGGLVLEPKSGLYDKYVLLLDFNSLYPSIIQEYNICFTTVERSSDGLVPRLPSSRRDGVLPKLLRNLVQRRRTVKSWMKTASGIKLQQFDIQQQALKLTANSMYGCLGFSNSRFYAKPLAELITSQGREILQSTVDLVQNNLNLEVIYGDTDSIMIYSGLDDIPKAKVIAGKVIQEVNKKYKCLEIDLDGLYKRMLLLKKKKYAAVKVEFKDGSVYEVIERKGLDIVRRDWSLLSKELGDFCLGQILSGGTCEDVVESIHNSLMKVQEEMRNGQVTLDKYVITKTLTKPPEAYPDAKNQPHVQVALRLKQSGYSSGWSAGDTIPYIVCCEQDTTSVSSTGIAQRARHPDEVKRDDGKWMIDIDYYLSQQIHPVVSRLCACIQGTSPERLANCLGLDSSKFLSKQREAAANDPSDSLLFAVDEEDRYRGCAPLNLTCPGCSGTFECPAVFTSIIMSNSKMPMERQQEEPAAIFWHKLRCPRCPEEGDVATMTPGMIANQVRRQVEGFISMYYKGIMTCDDETCKHTTRSVSLKLVGDSERGTVCPNYPRCNGRLVRKCTEADLYKQLAYFCHLLDTGCSTDKMETNMRVQVEKELAKVRPLVDLAASAVRRIRDRCAYGWVQMQDLTVSV